MTSYDLKPFLKGLEMNDENLRKCLAVANLVSMSIEINIDVYNRIMISIPYTWKKTRKEDDTMTSFCGRGETIELACKDFLSNCNGLLIRQDGHNPDKEVAVVVL